MNQGRIWCVVSPTVGLPLLLGSVAVTSLIVHASVMTHTTWMGSYWMGAARTRVSENTTPTTTATPAPVAGAAFAVTMTPVAAVGTTPASFVINVTANPVPSAAAEPATTQLQSASAE